ncbi:MAG: nuclear transport factor 2 family protein [Acidimicrobiales bacterium]|nr:nuclear transport factor 2 family protein [Acidimicrobiales bacterium]
MDRSEIEVAVAFNAAINARDVERLVALMSPDHRFVDSGGVVVAGRRPCRETWTSFFESFPDYRNIFETIERVAPGQVVVRGRSECAFELLDGPARWRADVSDGLVATWQVEDPAAAGERQHEGANP